MCDISQNRSPTEIHVPVMQDGFVGAVEQQPIHSACIDLFISINQLAYDFDRVYAVYAVVVLFASALLN